MTEVVNLRHSKYDIYCGRAGKGQSGYFGNPHVIGFCKICNRLHDREDSINEYKKDFNTRIYKDAEFRNRIHSLMGKILGCFCKPLACHCDIIADYLNVLEKEWHEKTAALEFYDSPNSPLTN